MKLPRSPHGFPLTHAILVVFFSLLLLAVPWVPSTCGAVDPDRNLEKTPKNKFRQREASDDMLGYPHMDEDALLNTKCPRHVELRWQTEVSSSVYASPLIADVNGDGKLDVVVPSFVHYLEVLEGSDGDKMAGWPAFHQSTVHASPLLFDIDKDGTREIALATYNGVIHFFRTSGYMMIDKLEVPRRKIRKDWYVGLNPDPVDRSHPDVHDQSLVHEAADMNQMSQKNANISVLNTTPSSATEGSNNLTSNPSTLGNKTENHTAIAGQGLQLPSVSNNATLNEQSLGGSIGENSTTKGSNNMTANASPLGNKKENHTAIAGQGRQVPSLLNNATLNEQSLGGSIGENSTRTQRKLLEESKSGRSTEAVSNAKGNGDAVILNSTVENDMNLDDDADSSFDLFRNNEEMSDEYNYDYDDYVDESMWGDEEWTEGRHERMEDYVNVDAHILSTPVIADIDNDGVSEMIVAVSHFFDREYYDNPEHSKELGNIDIEKYVAGAIVVFNLDTKQVKWTVDLDLSTDKGKFRAYIYSSPTVVDLDGDGNLDILIGTAYGLFYVLDHHGKVRDKFPLEMAEIQAPVVAADINDDGKIEMVTADVHGNVAAWTAQGKEIWEVHLKSLIPKAPTIGDIDGDGHTEIVVPTVSGNIYVLSGKDGSFVHPFPYRTHGRVMNQVLLLDLSKQDEKQRVLSLVTTSFDGYLYIIDGKTACADVVDIGETSYTMVLADNVDGGDDIDLIVTTMNGNVFCFSTPSRHLPLKAWRSTTQGRNNFAARHNRQGIYISSTSRIFRDEEGKHFWVELEIIDRYRYPLGHQGPYNVTTTLLVPGNYQGERRILQNHIFSKPGKQRIKLPTVPVRTTGTVLVDMVDKNGLHFTDEFSLTFHMYYYKLLKWLVVLPMVGMFGLLVILRPQEGVSLPSFSRNTD